MGNDCGVPGYLLSKPHVVLMMVMWPQPSPLPRGCQCWEGSPVRTVWILELAGREMPNTYVKARHARGLLSASQSSMVLPGRRQINKLEPSFLFIPGKDNTGWEGCGGKRRPGVGLTWFIPQLYIVQGGNITGPLSASVSSPVWGWEWYLHFLGSLRGADELTHGA